jgi:hypothetical protein
MFDRLYRNSHRLQQIEQKLGKMRGRRLSEFVAIPWIRIKAGDQRTYLLSPVLARFTTLLRIHAPRLRPGIPLKRTPFRRDIGSENVSSLHRDALGEIARLVCIGPLLHRDVIGEELDRDRVQQGRAVRDRDAEGTGAIEPRDPGGVGDDHHPTAAGDNLLDIGQRLLEQRVG